ncbi:DUF421 domain-containing protein [Sphingomonas desiccabilis]|uniref:DUF421 domain-containing protein n=1 Tax=Sphingomonas desiccabilis TaxID=429134 RepID=A0A4Q2IPI7_9SPHN|nr:YetF domain-containing protein [Sphingomonas desiccabilis]MBB3912671.1 uncharacterized membrane protein YcaP (DUF421 family) [Sphingomonas desiccabilis]RXZ29953.1 DUF421 domain-containing protein [Sphingomonas desiccabilis]
MLFDSWQGLGRVLLVGALAYVALVAILRISGKRTLAKMNAFDLVVTVALGSTLATILLSKDVALAEGVLAFALLAALQFVVAWSSGRSRAVEQLAKAEPRVLLADGRFRDDALASERVTRDEVRAAVRGAGFGDLTRLAAVVLETDGSLSVIAATRAGDRAALPRHDG